MIFILTYKQININIQEKKLYYKQMNINIRNMCSFFIYL